MAKLSKALLQAAAKQQEYNAQNVSPTRENLKTVGDLLSSGNAINTGYNRENSINMEEYAPYVDAVRDNYLLDKERALRQSGYEQLGHGVARVGLNVIPTMIGNLAAIADIEDYFNQDAEVGNAITSAMESLKETTNENLPIYRVNQDKPLDTSDSAWWFENGSSLVESALAFVGTGYVTGAAIGTALTKGAQASKWLSTLGKTSKLGVGEAGAMGLDKATTVLNAVGLNQAESIGIATSVYDSVYKDELNKSNDENAARKKAADAASYSINMNRANILLNLTSASLFTRPTAFTRKLIENPSLKRTANRILSEGAQEYGEETMNLYSENEALRYAKEGNIKRGIDLRGIAESAFTAEGFEAGLLGFIGGVAQTGASIGINAAKGDYKEQKEKYEIQQKDLKAFSQLQEQIYQSGGTVKDASELFNAVVETGQIVAEINRLEQSEDKADHTKADALKDVLLSKNAFRAFNNGTTEQLINIYEQFANLTEEQAAERQLPANYKELANRAIQKINDLEKVFLDVTSYKNSSELWDSESQRVRIESAIPEIRSFLLKAEERSQSLLNTKLKNGEINLKDKEGIEIPFTLSDLLDPEAAKNLLQTDEQKEIFDSVYNSLIGQASITNYLSLNNTLQRYEERVNELKALYDTRTSKKYQDNYAKQLEEDKKAFEKMQAERTAKTSNASTVSNTTAPIEKEVIEEEQEEEQEIPDTGVPEDSGDITGGDLFGEETVDETNETENEQETKLQVVNPADITSKTKLNKLNKAQLLSLAEQVIPITADESSKAKSSDTNKVLKSKISAYLFNDTKTSGDNAVRQSSEIEDGKHYNSSINAKIEFDVAKVIADYNQNLNPETGFNQLNPYGLPSIGASVVANLAVDYVEDENGIVIANASDVVKNTYNMQISDPSYLTENTELEFRVVDEYFDETEQRTITIDELRQREVAEGLPENSYIPIQIINKTDGKLIGYVHTYTWIDSNRINPVTVNEERNRLLAIRQAIVNAGGVATGKVEEKSGGKLFVSSTKKFQLASDAFENPNLSYGYIDANGSVITGFRNNLPVSVSVVNNYRSLRELTGRAVILLPNATGDLIAIPIKINKVTKSHAHTITNAVRAYRKPTEYKSVIDKIKQDLGIDISTLNGLRAFVKIFIRNYQNNSDLTFSESLRLEDSRDFNAFSVSNNSIEFGRSIGQPILPNTKDILYITKSTPDDVAEGILNVMEYHLQTMYYGINKENLGKSNFKVPVISGKEVSYENYSDYNSFAKELTRTNLSELRTQKDNGETQYSYTIQSRIYFSLDNIAEGERDINNTVPIEEAINRAENPLNIKINEDELDTLPDEFLLEDDKEGDTDKTLTVKDSRILISGLTPLRQSIIVDGLTATISKFLLRNENMGYKAQDVNDIINGNIEGYRKVLQSIATNYPDTAQGKDAQKVLDQFDKFSFLVKYTLGQKKYIKVSSVDSETDNSTIQDGLEDSEIEQASFFDDHSSFKVNHQKNVPLKLRQFLEFVSFPADTPKYLQQYRYHNYDEIYNTLMSLLIGTKPNFGLMIAKLESTSSSKAFEWLPNIINSLKEADEDIKNAFVEAMTKHHANMFYISVSKSGRDSYNVIVKNANRNSLTERLVDTWASELFDANTISMINEYDNTTDSEDHSSEYDVKYNDDAKQKITSIVDEIVKLEVNNIGSPVDRELAKSLVTDFFNSLGISITEFTVDDILNGTVKDRNQRPIPFRNHIGGLFKITKAAINSKKNPNISNIITNQGVFRLLAANEIHYVKNLYNNSFRSGNSTIWSNTLNNFASDRFNDLITSVELLQQLSNNPYSGSSTWLNRLFDKETGKLIVSNFSKEFAFGYSSLEAFKADNSGFKGLDQSTEGEFEAAKVNYLLNNGKSTGGADNERIGLMMYPTLSDKSKVILIKTLMEEVGYDAEKGTIDDFTVKKLYDILVRPELNRMYANKSLNLENYEDGKKVFFSFPELNFIDELFGEGEVGDRIVLREKVEADGKKYNERILQAIKTSINSKIEKKVAKWNKLQIPIDKNALASIGEGNLNRVAAYYIVNNAIGLQNVQQLFNLDPAKYFKKSKSGSLVESINETLDNVGKRLAGHNAPGNYFNQGANEKIRYLVLPDIKVDVSQYNYIVDQYKSAYTGVNSTDAQEFTTWQEHLDILHRRGQLNKDQYERYKVAIEAGTLSKNDLNKFIFGAQKPVYMGARYENGEEIPFYVKSSSIPLVPQLIKGNPTLEALEKRMQQDNIHRVAFSSAVKAGLPKKLSKDGYIVDVPRSGFKIQQEVPIKDKEESVDGTQKRKLIFSNLSLDDKIGEITIKQLEEDYIAAYKEIFESRRKKLIERLSDNNKSISTKKLIEVIRSEALERGYNLNELIGIEEVYDKEKGKFQLRLPLAFSWSNVKIQNLVMSIVDKQIRHINRPGNSYVLVSEEQFHSSGVSKQGLIHYLKDHDITKRLQKGEVILPWPSSFGNIKEYLNPDGTLKSDIPEWMMKVIGYRIPTQGHNSMDAMKVVGFIDSAIKTNIVITSAHYIAQMGQDFDVDKLYIHRSADPNSESEEDILKNELFDIEYMVLSSNLKQIREGGQEPIQHDSLKSISKRYANAVVEANNILDEEYQSFKYLNARSAKSAIGVFSSLSVMLAQSQNKNLYFIDTAPDVGEYEVVIRVAGKSGNRISDFKTINGNRNKSSVISVYQSASMDNEKDQILDKLNINSYTFEAINTLLASGFEEDVISAITNQPIVKEYIKNLESKLSLYSETADAETYARQKTFNDYNSDFIDTDSAISIIEESSVSELEDFINNPTNENQIGALAKFLELTDYGRRLKSLNSTINFESKGISPNIFENYAQYKDIFNLPKLKIANAEKLIGNYTVNNSKKQEVKIVNSPAPTTVEPSTQTDAQVQVKEGVPELFESNPELANAVYEALGFYRQSNLSKKDKLQKLANVNKGNIVNVKYDKYKTPFKATITGEIEQVVSPTEIKYDDGRIEYKDDGIYRLQIKSSTGKILTADTSEITGLSELENVEITPEQKQKAQELYSQYLDTVFANSQVKDIVYHGTDTKFEKFSLDDFGKTSSIIDVTDIVGISVSGGKKGAEFYGNIVLPVLVSITNPTSNILEANSEGVVKQNWKNYDAVIDSNSVLLGGEKPISDTYEIIIKDSEQIHILGSKQDIEGFSKFIKSNIDEQLLENDINNEINYKLKAIDILQSEKAKQVFEKGEKNNWNLEKILTELQVPKEQKQIILDKYKDKVSEQEFIKSIFPDTEVNEIVYRGDHKNLEKFTTKYSNSQYGFHTGIFFSSDLEYIEKEYGNPNNNKQVYKAILNIKYLKEADDPLNKESVSKYFLEESLPPYDDPRFDELSEKEQKEEIKKWEKNSKERYPFYGIKGIDSGMVFELFHRDNPKGFEYVVAQPDQVHILTKEEESKIYSLDNLREEIITFLNVINQDILLLEKESKIEETIPGSYTLGNTTITPNTIYGHANLATLSTAIQLFEEHFPSIQEGTAFYNTSERIIKNSIAVSSSKNRSEADIRTRIWTSYKSFIYNRVYNKVYKNDVRSEYKRLLFDNLVLDPETGGIQEVINASLARRILEAKKKYNKFADNEFIKRLQFPAPTNNLRIIKYLSSAGEGNNEFAIHTAIRELFNANNSEIKNIAHDLVKYSFLTGGDRTFVDFNKYIPVEYLEEIGILKELRDSKEKYINNIGNFVIQYFQNNTKDVAKITSDSAKQLFIKVKGSNEFVIKDDLPKELKTLITTKEGAYRMMLMIDNNLYASTGNNSYIPISKLGLSYGNTEFYPDEAMPISQLSSNHPKGIKLGERKVLQPQIKENPVKNTSIEDEPIKVMFTESSYRGNQINQALDELLLEEKTLLGQYVQYLKEFNKNNLSLVLDDKTNSGVRGKYLNNIATVYLNNNKTKERAVQAILHELTHAVVAKNLVTTSDANKKKVTSLRIQAKNAIATELGIPLEQTAEREVFEKALKRVGADRRIISLAKSLTDKTNQEFVAEVMSNSYFQEKLKTIKTAEKASIFNKLMEALMTILGIDPNTVLANAFEVITTIAEEGNVKQKSLPTDLVTVNVTNIPYKISLSTGEVFDSENNSVTDSQTILRARYKYNLSKGEKKTINNIKYVKVGSELLGLYPDNIVKAIEPGTEEYASFVTDNVEIVSDDDLFGTESDNSKETPNTDITNKYLDFLKNNIIDTPDNFDPGELNLEDDIDDDTESSPEDNDSDRFYKLSNFKKAQIKRLTNEEIIAKSKNDRVALDNIRKRKEKLEEDIKNLQVAVTVDDLISYGTRDLEEAENILSKGGINDSQLRELRKIVSLWQKGVDIFFTDTERLTPKLLNKYSAITTKATYLSNIIYQNELRTLTKFVNDNLNTEYTTDQLIKQLGSDVGIFASQGLSIDRYGKAILTAISKSLTDANQRAKEEADALSKEVDKVIKVVENKLNGDWSSFFQEYQTGNKERTGNLIFRYSQEYFDAKYELLQEAKSKRNKLAWKKYFDFINENEIQFDVRILAPIENVFTEQDDIEINKVSTTINPNSPAAKAHIKSLKDALGERGYNEMLKRQKKELENYKSDYQHQKETIDNYNISQEEKAKLLKQWVEANSPYHYIQNKSKAFHFEKNVGYKYIKSVPRRDINNGLWYDKKFAAIENDAELLEVYEYIVETFGTLYKVFPADVLEKVQVNTLPEIKKNIVELFSDNKMIGIESIWESVQKSLTDKTGGDVQSGVIDPLTGSIDTSTLRAEHLPNKEKLREIVLKKKIKFRSTNGRNPNKTELNQIYREAKKQIAEDNTQDLGVMLKAFAMTTLAYKHKSRIEDSIRIAEDVIRNSVEPELVEGTDRTVSDREGNPINKDDKKSYENMVKSVEYHIKTVLYNEGYKKEGIFGDRKARTLTEKRNEKELNELIQLLKDQFEAGTINETVYNRELNRLNSELEKNKSQRSVSSIGDTILKASQIKGMGWNVLAAVANLGFGGIANYIEAAGGELYTLSELNKANVLVLSSIPKNYGITTSTARKIRALMDKFDVLKESSHELYKPSITSWANKFFKRFLPYQLNKHTEYLNQAPLMVATMLHKKVTDINGNEVTLWDAFNEDGTWNTDLMGENTSWEGDPNNYSHNKEKLSYKNLLEALIAKNHGNYDPNNPIRGKEQILGRLLLQFRSWALEGIHNRFGENQFDDKMGLYREGRYRTIWNLMNRQDFSLLKSLISKAERGKLSAMEQANMKRNLAELLIYTTITSLLLMLKGMSDDDEKDAFLTNILINTLGRVGNDITFYLNPETAYDVLKQPIPALRTITDATDILTASWKLLLGKDKIKGGFYDGDSRIMKEITEFIPFGSQVKRVVTTGERIF